MDRDVARHEYDLQLARAYARATRAALRRESLADAAVLARVEEELAAIHHVLAGLDGDRPMTALARDLGLGDDEVDFLWTAVALAAHPPMRTQAAHLDDLAAHGLTTGLYARMVELPPDRARSLGLAFANAHPLVEQGLVRVAGLERVPTAWTLTPAVELIAHLAGEPARDPEGLLVEAPATVILDDRQRAALEMIRDALAKPSPLALFVEGPALHGRRTAVVLAAPGPVLAVDLTRAPTAATLAALLSTLRRDSLLRGATPVIAGLEDLAASEGGRDERLRILSHFLDTSRGPVVLVATRAGIDAGTRLPSVRVEWPVPDVASRIAQWTALVGDDAPPDAAVQLAVRFPLGAGAIRRAVESARLLARGGGALTAAELMAGVRHNIAERLGHVAERVTVKQTWDDLVLAEDTMMQIRALVARVRHSHVVYEEWGYKTKMPRGVGVAALFSGPPGTGKTMVAGLIAQELELDLYQIDLSKVVSKWVGETEKQLANVFDAAEAGHALLLFDEADALFGQRTSDVKGANDRYANLEVNFLLQRIERFGGVVVLTTNLDTSIDKALKRRLAAHVVFPHPDDDERRLLWQRLLSAEGAPLARDIDARKLAEAFPKMTGANIRNAVLSAAFLAASERRTEIDQEILQYAARGEYLAMGQVLTTQLARPMR